MYKAILSNWKLTLMWALGICASTAFFFGRGGDAQLTESIQQISAGAAEPVAPPPAPAPEPDQIYDESEWGSSGGN